MNVRGEHDLSTVEALTATMTGAIALGDADLALDLGAVRFMDASTIGVILHIRTLLRQRSRSLTVQDPSACARRLLELCGLAELIEVDLADLVFPTGLDLVERPQAQSDRRSDPPRPPKPVRRLCPVPIPLRSPP